MMNKQLMALMATSELSSAQLSGLSREQLSWLSGADVLAVPGLYSKILRDIQTRVRELDQSTFGPADDPGEDICRTPMCIAGHTVNLAGDAGYRLAKKIGFPEAAALIHYKSRPDAPAPRYDSYPNEWALAYIEARAAEENEPAPAL